MKNIFAQVILTSVLLLAIPDNCFTRVKISISKQEQMKEQKKLAVVWTSGDKDVAEKMVFMYAFNAAKNGWWDDVNLIVWGPSSKLLSEDKDLQEYIGKMQKEGIHIFACKACADMYHVADDLEKLGIEVKYMGEDLTHYLQSDYKVITF